MNEAIPYPVPDGRQRSFCVHLPTCAARAVEVYGAGLEGRDHAPCRFVEQDADQLPHQRRAELEIDVEVEPAAAARGVPEAR